MYYHYMPREIDFMDNHKYSKENYSRDINDNQWQSSENSQFRSVDQHSRDDETSLPIDNRQRIESNPTAGNNVNRTQKSSPFIVHQSSMEFRKNRQMVDSYQGRKDAGFFWDTGFYWKRVTRDPERLDISSQDLNKRKAPSKEFLYPHMSTPNSENYHSPQGKPMVALSPEVSPVKRTYDNRAYFQEYSRLPQDSRVRSPTLSHSSKGSNRRDSPQERYHSPYSDRPESHERYPPKGYQHTNQPRNDSRERFQESVSPVRSSKEYYHRSKPTTTAVSRSTPPLKSIPKESSKYIPNKQKSSVSPSTDAPVEKHRSPKSSKKPDGSQIKNRRSANIVDLDKVMTSPLTSPLTSPSTQTNISGKISTPVSTISNSKSPVVGKVSRNDSDIKAFKEEKMMPDVIGIKNQQKQGSVSQRDARRSRQNVNPGHDVMKPQEGLITNVHSSIDRYHGYDHHVSTSMEKLHPDGLLSYDKQSRKENPIKRQRTDIRSPSSDHDLFTSSNNRRSLDTPTYAQNYQATSNRRYSDLPHYSQEQVKPLQTSGSHPQGLDFTQTPPPKPPRRHQSLNRIHIPEDKEEILLNEGEFSDNENYREWQNSPLVGKKVESTHSVRNDRIDRDRNYERDRYFDAPISRSVSECNVPRSGQNKRDRNSGMYSPTYQDAPISRSRSDCEFLLVEPDRRNNSRSQPIPFSENGSSYTPNQNQADSVISSSMRPESISPEHQSAEARCEEYSHILRLSPRAYDDYLRSPSMQSPLQSPNQRESNSEMYRAGNQMIPSPLQSPNQRESNSEMYRAGNQMIPSPLQSPNQRGSNNDMYRVRNQMRPSPLQSPNQRGSNNDMYRVGNQMRPSPRQSPNQRGSNNEIYRVGNQSRSSPRQSRRDVYTENYREKQLGIHHTSSQNSLHRSKDQLHHNPDYFPTNSQSGYGVNNQSYIAEDYIKSYNSYNHQFSSTHKEYKPKQYSEDNRVNNYPQNHIKYLPQSYGVPHTGLQRPRHLSLDEYRDAHFTSTFVDEKFSLETHTFSDKTKSQKMYPQHQSLDHSFKFQTIDNNGKRPMQSQPKQIQDQQDYATSKETVYDNLYPSYQKQFRSPVSSPERSLNWEDHLRKQDNRSNIKPSLIDSPCSTDSEIRALNEPLIKDSKRFKTESQPERRVPHSYSMPDRSDGIQRQKHVDEHAGQIRRADTDPVPTDVWVQRDDFSPTAQKVSRIREERASPLTGRRVLIPKQPTRNLKNDVYNETKDYTSINKRYASQPNEQLQWVYSGLPSQSNRVHGKRNSEGTIERPKSEVLQRNSDSDRPCSYSPQLNKQYTIPGNFKLPATDIKESISSPDQLESRSLSESKDVGSVKPRGRLKNRYSGSLSAPGRRSKSLPRIAQQSEDLCYSASNLAHYSKVKSVDELSEASLIKGEPVSPGALLFAQKRLEKDLADLAETQIDSIEKYDSSPEVDSVLIKQEKKEILEQHRCYIEHRTKKQEEILSEMTSLNPDFVHPSPFSLHKSRKFEQEVERAIDELEDFHNIVDKQADCALHPKQYKPFDHRAHEMPVPCDQEEEFHAKGSKNNITLAQRKRRGRKDQFGTLTSSKSLDSIPNSLNLSQEFLPFRQAQHSNSAQSSLSKSTESLHSPRKSRRSSSKIDSRSSSDEDLQRYTRKSLSSGSLYKQPHFDNMGFSSDSCPSSPERSMHHRKVKTKSSEDNSLNFGSIENLQHVIDNLRSTDICREPVEEPELVKIVIEAEETSPNIFDKLRTVPVSANNLSVAMPGERFSVASVSSIDSQALSRPFEEMDEEYNHLVVDHRVDVLSDDDPGDITPEDLFNFGGTISATCFPRHLIKPDAKKPPVYPRRSSESQSPSPPKEQSKSPTTKVIKNLPSPNSIAPMAFEESLSDTDGNNTSACEVSDDCAPDIADSQVYNRPYDRVGVVAPRLKKTSEDYSFVQEGQERGYHAYKVDDSRRDLEIPEAPQHSEDSTESGEAPVTEIIEEQEQENMERSSSNRSVKPVARLRDKFSDRPSSYHTSSERQQRFHASRPSSGSFSLRGDTYESQSSYRYSGDYSRYSPRDRISSTDSSLSQDRYKHRSPLSPTDNVTSRARTRPSSLTGSFDPKRASTESGYGSLEKEIKRSSRPSESRYSSHKNKVDKSDTNSLTDKYLGARSPNGNLSPRYSPTSPKYSTNSPKMGGTLATTASEKLTQLRQQISGSESSEDLEARSARIAKYKEQRKRELAEKYGIGISPSSSETDLTTKRISKERPLDSGGSNKEEQTKAPLAKEESIDSVSSKSSTKLEKDDDDVFMHKEDSQGTRISIDSSVISQETKQLVTALEASRAARRERMRRAGSIGEMTTDQILARHKTRKDSDSEKRTIQVQEADTETRSSISSAELLLTSLPSETRVETEVNEESRTDEIEPAQDNKAFQEEVVVPVKELVVNEPPVQEPPVKEPSRHIRQPRSRDRHRKQCVPITQEELRKARELEFGIETKFGPDICDEPSQEEPAIEEQRQWAEKAIKSSPHQEELDEVFNFSSDDDMMQRQKRELSRREQDAIKIHLDRVNKAKAAKDGSSPRKISTTKSERIERREVSSRKLSSSSRQKTASPILSPDEGSASGNRIRKRSESSKSVSIDVTSSTRVRLTENEKNDKEKNYNSRTRKESKVANVESEKSRKLSSSLQTGMKQETVEKNREKKSPERKKSSTSLRTESHYEKNETVQKRHEKKSPECKKSSSTLRTEIHQEKKAIVDKSCEKKSPECKKSSSTLQTEINQEKKVIVQKNREKKSPERKKSSARIENKEVSTTRQSTQKSVSTTQTVQEKKSLDTKVTETVAITRKAEKLSENEGKRKSSPSKERRKSEIIDKPSSKLIKDTRKLSSSVSISSSSDDTSSSRFRRHGSLRTKAEMEKDKSNFNALQMKDEELLSMMKLRRSQLIESSSDSQEDDKQMTKTSKEITNVNISERLEKFEQIESPKSQRSSMRKSCSFDLPPEELAKEDCKTDELSSLSISQKKMMFAKIAVESSTPPSSPKPVHRCVQRLRGHDSRWQTQPVTPEELTDAVKWAENQSIRSQSSTSLDSTPEVQEDEFSKLSLSEKMKLFKEKSETKKDPPPKRTTPRRKKRTESRFKTQPVTIEEVKKAGSFSPLACSFAKPPDPELLKTLSVADQMKLVFNEQNAERNSLTGSRGSLSLSGSRGSITERRESQSDVKDTDTIEPDNMISTPTGSPALRRSILKKQASGDSPEGDGLDSPRSILKIERRDSFNNVVRQESCKVERSLADDSIRAERVRSILKTEQELTIETDKDVPSILRKDSGADKKDVGGILRKDTELEQRRDSVESKSILKRDTSKDKLEVSGILKRDVCDTKEVDQDKSNGILKKSPEHKVKQSSKVSADISSSESEGEVRRRKKSREEKKGTRRALAKESGGSDRYRTQPVESSKSEKEQAKKPVKKPTTPPSQRFKTQPITPDEMAQVKQLIEPSDTKASISERLQNLKRNGQEGWKKRLNKYDDVPKSTVNDRLSPLENSASVKSNGEVVDKPSSKMGIAERLQALQQSGENHWKSKVQKKDIEQFTIQGKLEKAGKSSDSVSSEEKLSIVNRKRPGSFRTISQKKEKNEEKENETKKNQINGKSFLLPTKFKVSSSSSSTPTTTESSESEPEVRLIKKNISVLVPGDDKFEEFFQSSSKTVTTVSSTKKVEQVTSLSQEITISDFDLLTEKSGPRLDSVVSSHKRTLRPQRRVRGSVNPVKALKNREDVRSEYTEERKEVVQIQTKTQSQKNIGGKQTDFTGYSLAYFTSRMDLKRVSLRKPGEARVVEGSMLPYKDLMLMQIKGRKSVQARLVEPVAKSLNSGDCFVLVTPKDIYCWQGEYANILEKSKAAEFAQYTLTKKDLGCKATEVHLIQEKKTKFGRPVKEFFKLLGGEECYQDVRGAEEDEIREIYINETNMIYRLKDEKLEPYKIYWEQIPKYEMFNSNEILVFDFGSELYLWQGRSTSVADRKLGLKLCQLIWDQGYDYSDYDINPIFPSNPEKSKKGKSRPDWALFAKINERMETILFQCKFDDWPNDSRIIRVKSQDDSQKKEPMAELVAWDAKKMLAPSLDKGYLILEGTNLGRGTGTASLEPAKADIAGYFDKFQSRGNEVVTISVATWHIMEFERSIMPKECFGQLHEGDTYVVRWQYRIESTGMRDLKGNVSTRGIGHGKEKCAYFFWQGSRSTINEQGASALMTVELDDERGPQIRVTQGKEHAAFLNLFQSSLIIHMGKREEEETNTQGSYRLYMARAEEENEGWLLELPCVPHSLRSRSSFVLLNLEKIKQDEAEVYVWHGVKSSAITRQNARKCANKMKENLPFEAGLNPQCKVSIQEMEEGKELKTFKNILKMDIKSYDSAIGDSMEFDFTPRCFHLTSTSGVFKANEIINPARSSQNACPFPILQSDLYSVAQPAQFLLDNHYEVYLWQGWWPQDTEEDGIVKTGSAKMRWDIDRKCAMQTVMEYCKEKRPSNPPRAFLIHAGLEPLTFTNLFPYWEHSLEVEEINKEEGRSGDKAILVKDVLEKLTKSRYTLAELKERPLPEGVDPLKLEVYLSDEEFEEILKMPKDEFSQLPAWKQKNLKKNVGLF
ncbi:uncharacterized protein [Antedon mediterranea]|uniref:uncharacterized protein isoform X2 n=1 Tax=Antedon mediterranea TaxID=105859 RepID=UPI003AF731DF